ncbi:hypothetical protein FPV67DRAFT_1494080 [Lyophyllum atratum]|nr:hypothetical protein FPV67DRAFT_1494080 [Lyophyllum atratum]
MTSIYIDAGPFTTEVVEASPIEPWQPPAYSSRPPSYAPPQTQSLCQECGIYPKVLTVHGFEHPFCSKTCARKHLHALSTTATPTPSQTLCLGCGKYPQAVSGGTQYPHCSRTCARKWPITSRGCALTGCLTPITGAFGSFCCAAHAHKSSRRQNVLHKKPLTLTPPPQYGQRVGGPLSAQPQRHGGATQLRHFCRSNPILTSAVAKPVLFYDKHAPHYGFTNFSQHPVVFEGKKYPTSEHLFQSFKFHDHKPYLAEHIRKCSSKPSVAFAEARRYQQDVRPDWPHVNMEKMDITLWHKFTQHSSLKAELLATGDAELVEDSPIDAFWGVGHDGKGRNELGKALMRLRKQFRANP